MDLRGPAAMEDDGGTTPSQGQRSRIAQLVAHSDYVAVEGFAVENLKAIHKDGTPDPGWCAIAQAQLTTPPHKLQWKLLEKAPKKCVLGVGVHAQVWRAMDPRSGRHFAVKSLKQRAAQREVEVFERLRANPHPFIVQLFLVQNYDEARGCCLVMENCVGGDLMMKTYRIREAAAKANEPYVPPIQALLWIGEVFLGLEYLHREMDTLFRDLKPGNVLIDGKDQVKLADFGVSRLGAESPGAWTFGGPTGTPAYIAPEILKQAPTDYRADMFSLGVLSWVLFSGGLSEHRDPKPPSNLRNMQSGKDFEALFNDWSLFQEVVRDESGTRAPPITGDMQDFILQLSGEDPADRPDHAGVRAHPFLQSLELPAMDTQAVLEWLAHMNPAAANAAAEGTLPPGHNKLSGPPGSNKAPALGPPGSNRAPAPPGINHTSSPAWQQQGSAAPQLSSTAWGEPAEASQLSSATWAEVSPSVAPNVSGQELQDMLQERLRASRAKQYTAESWAP